MGIGHRFSCFVVLNVMFILCTSTWPCFCRNFTSFCREEDQLALLEFKQSLWSESPGLLQSWEMEDCCRWAGVACDPKTGHVSKVELRPSLFPSSLMDLQPDKPFSASELSPSISKLRYITHLDLSGIEITNDALIPQFIGSMKQLHYLNLSNVGFNGIIPSYLGNLTHLEVLDLCSEFSFSTLRDPRWISNLTVLRYLDMTGQQLHNAHDLMEVLGELPSLTHLVLSYSGINNYHLSHSRGLQNHSFFANLQYLDLSNNEFQDQIPSNMVQNIPSLIYLDLSTNYFDSFETPFPLSPLLRHLDISVNLFQGQIPVALQNMTSLTYLDLSQNFFTSIPMWFTSLKSLVHLDLRSNTLNHIEEGFLTLLRGKCNLKSLKVNDNHLLGEMSDGNSTTFCAFSLEEVDASNNNLEGNLPDWLWNLTNLRYLSLSYNRLQGTIPESLSRLRSLRWLDLAQNLLSGPIPLQLCSLSMLNILDLSGNNLVGMLPEELTGLIQLRDLNLAHNHLSGNIPGKISDMKWLESLDVSNNNLSGTIPQGTSTLTFLSHINLSNNNFTGRIPRGNRLDTLYRSDHSIYAGNPFLCGDPLQKKCQGDKEAEGDRSNSLDKIAKGDKSNSLDKIILYGAIFIGFTIGFWGVIGTLVLRKDWRIAYFRFAEETMDKVYVVAIVEVAKRKRRMNS